MPEIIMILILLAIVYFLTKRKKAKEEAVSYTHLTLPTT